MKELRLPLDFSPTLFTIDKIFLWFNKKVDGGLRWYVYIYWGGRTPACRQAYLPPLFNIWVTGPGNPNNSSKLRATLGATFESQSNTITAREVITVKVWVCFKSWIQNCSQHTVRYQIVVLIFSVHFFMLCKAKIDFG